MPDHQQAHQVPEARAPLHAQRRGPRLTSLASIVLPVTASLDQYKATEQPLIRHFRFISMPHSVGKADAGQQPALVPPALHGLASGSAASDSGLFNLSLRVIPVVRSPPRGSQEDAGFRGEMGLA